ncbi:MAG TPA: type III pantothenate kinase [Epulopiscium sp.]|nr:type III pantothenate kinase [Candidatus Epulonipiscium sp.]
MILVVDVGNTNIVVGVMVSTELIGGWRMTSQSPRSSDEYGILILEFLKQKNINISDIEDVIISCVVPDILYSLSGSFKKYLDLTPITIGPGLKTGIDIRTDNPREVGADRIVNVVAGYELHGGPAMIIDFGTATTYDVVTEKGEFIAGITSPGIRISADALWERAAQLPKFEIKRPKHILDAKNTITSMQAGLVYGYIGQVEYIAKKVKEELGVENLKIIATGGLGKIIQEGTDVIDVYDPLLTLKGLSLIYDKNKK